jgi:LysM repeat protein
MPVFEPIPVPPADTNDLLLDPVVDLPPGDGGPTATYPTPPDVVPPVETPSREPATVQQYTIQRGDTYYSIGKQFGVPMQAIKDANPGVEPTRLQVGQSINIPPPPVAAPEVVTPVVSGEIVYTVVSGDNLSKIASKYGTTWQEIKKLNNLTTTQIKVGDKLRIPAQQALDGGAPGSGF